MSPMPFGLLWCCYTLIRSSFPVHRQRHQCLSAFCGVVTAGGQPCGHLPGPVTNAFRPFVVLLHRFGSTVTW